MTVVHFPEGSERHVLSAMLQTGKACDRARGILTAQDFYTESHREIFHECLAVHDQRGVIDPGLVVEGLKRRGLDLGAVVAQLHAEQAAIGNVEHHARLVRDGSAARLLQRYALGLDKLTGSADELLDAAYARLDEIRDRVAGEQHGVVSSVDQAREFRELMASPRDDAGTVRAPYSFWPRLRKGAVYVLAGWTGDGKTWATLDALRAACAPNGFVDAGKQRRARVGVASLEMDQEWLRTRILMQLGMGKEQAETGRVPDALKPTVAAILGEMEQLPYDIVDSAGTDARRLVRLQRQYRWDLVVFDHLHQIEIDARRGDHRHALNEQLKSLVGLAREFRIPVIVVSQLRRSGDDLPRPTLPMLKESSSIEQLASAVWFLYRERDEFGRRLDATEFLVAKDRHEGLDGRKFALTFDTSRMRFVETDWRAEVAA